MMSRASPPPSLLSTEAEEEARLVAECGTALLDPLVQRLMAESRGVPLGMRITATSRMPSNNGDSTILEGVLR